VIALVVIIILLSLLSRTVQQPQDKKEQPPPFVESRVTPSPAGPLAQFTAHVPPWLDVAAAPTLAFVISGATAVILWWVWRRAEPASRDTLDRVVQQAQEAIDALRAGEAFEDVIIRSYVQLSYVVQTERAIRRDKAMTPYEFEQLLIQRGFPAQPVRDLTRLFEQVRYGHRTTVDVEQRRAIDSLEAIVSFCKSSGGNDA